MFYTSEELRKTHRYFFHPDSWHHYAMMHRSDGENTKPSDHLELESMASTCDICRRNRVAPTRFRASIRPEDVVFNRTICMDIIWLDGKTVLHMVDKYMKSSAAALLPNETAGATWNTYIRHWVAPYLGYALEIHADQRPQFRSKHFASNSSMSGVELRLSSVYSHNSLGVRDRYPTFPKKHLYEGTR